MLRIGGQREVDPQPADLPLGEDRQEGALDGGCVGFDHADEAAPRRAGRGDVAKGIHSEFSSLGGHCDGGRATGVVGGGEEWRPGKHVGEGGEAEIGEAVR